MIRKVSIHNFKSIRKQTYDFKQIDLIIGRNNSGKSTILQALAIWQYCIDEFDRAKRKGSTRGVGVVLPNFTVLPVPEFNLLWTEKTDRKYPDAPKASPSKKKQVYILIEIDVYWDKEGKPYSFKVQLRYQSPQTVYAIPADGWNLFQELKEKELLPKIAFVPPFSGLEPTEERRDDAPMRKQIGKAQPGSVLRNLLWRVYEGSSEDWKEVCKVVDEWFSVELLPPKYDASTTTHITCEYRDRNKKTYDIISGGSGFHQTLTLLAFLFGYHPDALLLDEPDAHLHVNLQQDILKYFKAQSIKRGNQFLIATHAEALIQGVDPGNIMSLLAREPKRIPDTQHVISAMADVTNLEATQILQTEAVLYIEGENDERILSMWEKLQPGILEKVFIRLMRGGSKKDMIEEANRHFKAVQHIVQKAKRLILVDNDGDPHFKSGDEAVYEWRRRNIENYLLVPPAWKRALSVATGWPETDFF